MPKEDEKQEELFPVDTPHEEDEASEDENEDEDPSEESKDNDEEEKEEKTIDYKKRYDDSQQFITELRQTNDAQSESIQDLTGRLAHLEEGAKKTHDVISPDEDFDAYKAPEKEPVNTKWADGIEKEEKALVSVFPDYYDIVGRDGVKDSPFLIAVNEDDSLRTRVMDSDKPAAEAYKIGIAFVAKQKKENKKEPKLKSTEKVKTLKDAPGSNDESKGKPMNDLESIFGR